jgi:hypothetical protein
LGTSSGAGGQPPDTDLQEWPAWHPGEVLTPLEEAMVMNAAAGELTKRGEPPFDLADQQAWGKERAVRAAVLRFLLATDEWPVDARGVQLCGLRIVGYLNLDAATLRCPLSLDECYLDAVEPVCLDQATALRIVLIGCSLAGLTGEMLSAREVDLSGSTLTGPLRLPRSQIAGQLSCRGTQLTGKDSNGSALVGDGMRVGGSVFLDQVFTAEGAIRLSGADIAGQLSCTGAQLTGKDSDGYALAADGMKAGDSVFLDQGFTAVGAIRLSGADIAGQLSCTGARLAGRDYNGSALVGDRMRVGGSVFLNRGSVFLDREFIADGAIRLSGADIAGQLSCTGAQLTGKDSDGYALAADGMKVGGDVLLDQAFTAAGTIWLRSARVGGSVALRPAALVGQIPVASGDQNVVALDAADAQVTGILLWAPDGQVFGEVNLERTTVGQLIDDWSSGRPNGFWPAEGRLRLDGFTYGRFGGDHPATAGQRLAWIRSQYQGDRPGAFTTQPYEQLVAVYQHAALENQASKVAIAKRADARRYGSLSPFGMASNWLLDKTIKYGYQTWRGAVALVGVYAAVLLVSWFAQHHSVIVPVGIITGLHPIPTATQCTANYPCFYPAGYAIDIVIPLINVHQASYWGVDGHAPWGWVVLAITWIGTGLGWTLATFLVAGLSTLFRRQ